MAKGVATATTWGRIVSAWDSLEAAGESDGHWWDKILNLKCCSCDSVIIDSTAYSNGIVLLINIENKEEIYNFNVKADISCINWTENNKEVPINDTSGDAIVSTYIYKLLRLALQPFTL